eukprot:384029-Pyramimonas_sp.AAC.2
MCALAAVISSMMHSPGRSAAPSTWVASAPCTTLQTVNVKNELDRAQRSSYSARGARVERKRCRAHATERTQGQVRKQQVKMQQEHGAP